MSRKTLPTHLNKARVAELIVPKIKKDWILLALLASAKKEQIMQYIKTDELPTKPSELQLLNSLYNGDEYLYGTADDRRAESVPSIPEAIQEIYDAIPASELETESKPKANKADVKIKENILNTVRSLKASGIGYEVVMTITSITQNLSAEEISEIYNS